MGAFHTALALPLVMVNGVAALWALGAHWLTALRVRPLWWLIALAHAGIFGQAMIGALAFSAIEGDRPTIHLFYGFLAITGVAILYAYRSHEAMERYRFALYGGGGLFVTGLLIRALLLRTGSAI